MHCTVLRENREGEGFDWGRTGRVLLSMYPVTGGEPHVVFDGGLTKIMHSIVSHESRGVMRVPPWFN